MRIADWAFAALLPAGYDESMCGRYTITHHPERVGELVPFDTLEMPFIPRYNVAPTQIAPVVVQSDAVRLEFWRWGMIPSWAKDESIGSRLINARAESLSDKPAFRHAFKRRRCLVPADSFYEWEKLPDRKQPHRILLESGEPFCFAGLYDVWRKRDGTEVPSFSIVTTEANSLVRPIHDRMPAILPAEAWAAWLDPSLTDPAQLGHMLRPYPAEEMRSYPVSPLVNSAQNETPACIEPMSAHPASRAEGHLNLKF